VPDDNGYRKSPFTEFGQPKKSVCDVHICAALEVGHCLQSPNECGYRASLTMSRRLACYPGYTSRILDTSLQLGEPLVAHARRQTKVVHEIRANTFCTLGAVPLRVVELESAGRAARNVSSFRTWFTPCYQDILYGA